MTEVLKTAKEALDKGLISKEEYDGVKGAFLKAQQIKAGLDAGFILEQDYDQVKTAFLQSLNLSSDGTVEVKLPGELQQCLRNPKLSPWKCIQVMLERNLQIKMWDLMSEYCSATPAEAPGPQLARLICSSYVGASSAATNVANGYARGLEVQPKDSTAAVQGQTTQSEVRSARTVIPTNIPKMGGSRRKQTGGVRLNIFTVMLVWK